VARLLLIEDEPDIRLLLDRYLKRSGFLVQTANDGEAGLAAFEQSHFDIIVTDGLLPKKTGFEIAASVRSSPKGKDIPIVMITAAFKTARSKKEAMDEGVDAFFTKPFILTDLRDKLVELLAKQGKTVGAPPKAEAPKPEAGKPEARTSKPDAPRPDAPRPDAPKPEAPKAEAPKAEARSAKPEVRSAKPEAPKPEKTRSDGPKARPALPTGAVETMHDAARALLSAARARLSGLVRFTDGDSRLEIALIRGVVVGASDNLREHLLGERLWKEGRLTTDQMRALNARMAEKGERVAEALLALGLCTADEALAFVDEQARTRVRRALTWTGTVECVEDEAAAQRFAVCSLDVAEIVLAFGLEELQKNEAERFVAANKQKKLERGGGFDSLLMALARVLPTSQLPGAVLAGTPTVAEAARASSPAEVFAAWLAGLVRLPEDPPPDARPLPELMRAETASTRVDKELVTLVCATLLKARGRSFYELLDVPRNIASEDALEKLAALTKKVGPAAAGGRSLGPASAAARELWNLLEDARKTFSMPSWREAHDQIHKERPPAPPAPPPRTPTPPPASPVADDVTLAPPARTPAPPPSPVEVRKSQAQPEDSFLRGQQALAAGDFVVALGCFELALASKPKDPEYQSYLGWTLVLSGDTPGGVARLMDAKRAHPQATRPQFFLAMCAARRGDVARARSLLEECARKSPHDVEIKAALSALA
jgi:CheY-like chemotaxis protein